MRTIIATYSIALVTCFLMGCASNPDLEPAAGANEIVGETEGATATAEGVNVIVQSDAWEGEDIVKAEVTPLKVTIENESERQVHVRYSSFSLVGPEGSAYGALPPYGVTGTVEEPTLVETYPVVNEPGFTYSRFEVAPYYGAVYPGLAVWSSPYYYDPAYYDRYFTYWQEIQLPTRHMLGVALPDGVLLEGGSVSGFVYFERVLPEVDQVRFEYELVDAASGDVFGTIEIPFEVE